MAIARTIAHTCIGVSDLDRALAFYRDGLGLEVAGRSDLPQGTVLVLLRCPQGGDELIELAYRPDNRSPVSDGGPGAVPSPAVGQRHVAFYVDDVRAAVAALETAGFAITRRPPPSGQGGSLIAFVKDPDGTDVELMEHR